MDCSLPGSSVHGTLQARILEWVAISFSRGSSRPRNPTEVSCVAGRFFTNWATREAQRTLDKCSVGWPREGAGFRTGIEQDPASEVDSLDAFLDRKALGKYGSCRRGHTTQRSDLEDQIALEFRTSLQNWDLNDSHRLDRTIRSNGRCEWGGRALSTLSALLFSRPLMSDSATPWTAAHQSSLSLTISWSLPKFTFLASVPCHPAISSSDALFSFCPRSFPASETFPVSHLCTADDQNTGASASASVLPVNIQDWSPLRLTGYYAAVPVPVTLVRRITYSLAVEIMKCPVVAMWHIAT